MSSWPLRFRSTLAFLGLVSILPAAVGAQPPAYLTQWGSPGTGNGQFNDPFSVATDAAGNVYVVDTGNHRIQKFTSTGTYITQWGSQGTGNGEFNSPFGIATDAAGGVYVSDAGNNRIQKFTGTGTYLTQWGLAPDSSGAQFNGPLGVATDAAGNVYVSDQNIRIQKFTSTGGYLTQWGSPGSGDGQFNYFPFGVTTDPSGNVYVSDFGGNRIQKFTSTGTYLTQWGSMGSGDGQFLSPYGLATDANGNVYVVDFDNHRIQKFTGTGTYLTQWGSLGSGEGQFSSPRGVATDAAGNVYVADQANDRIQKFGPESGPACVAVTFDFKPNRLNLISHGKCTGYIRPPAPYLASQVDVASIRLNQTVPVSDAEIMAQDNTLKVRFSRDELTLALAAGNRVPVTVTGTIAGSCFTATDSLEVMAVKMHDPAHDSQLLVGAETEVTWDADPSSASVSLLSSGEDGVTWRVEVETVPNTGSYAWSVPPTLAGRVRLGVLTVYETDETGVVTGSEFAVSDPFVVQATMNAADGKAELSLRPMNNPVSGPLDVRFTLASDKPATLAVFDVGGRRLASRQVGSMGPGQHSLRLGHMSPGLYVVRLTQAGRSLSSRVAVLD